jgi:hypothetical protein
MVAETVHVPDADVIEIRPELLTLHAVDDPDEYVTEPSLGASDGVASTSCVSPYVKS